jgi:hypothetical protein
MCRAKLKVTSFTKIGACTRWLNMGLILVNPMVPWLRALLNVKTCIGLIFPPRYLMGIFKK